LGSETNFAPRAALKPRTARAKFVSDPNYSSLTPISDLSPFAPRVVAWQRTHGRHDLPWQNTHDAYRIWLSEVMLQQTQVATALPYFSRFVSALPTVGALAAAPLSRVLELWSGLGYYRRAHHLHAAARVVVDRHDGRFPVDAATLTRLPGIGRTTAAAIAAFASGERGAILDGNVKRVLARHRGIAGWPGTPRVQAQLWRAAEALLPRTAGDIRAYTQGLMDLGVTVCTRTRPRCAECPVHDDCIAWTDGRTDELPAPRPRKPLPQRQVTVLLLERNGEILLEQRPPLGVWGGLWSFPELPVNEDVRVYVATHFGADARVVEAMASLTHVFTHFVLTMHPVRIHVATAPNAIGMRGSEWFAHEAAMAAALPAPVRRLLAARTFAPIGTLQA
jgi:A/G-specific adenine glycosylase